jgi:hypothetical protein
MEASLRLAERWPAAAEGEGAQHEALMAVQTEAEAEGRVEYRK